MRLGATPWKFQISLIHQTRDQHTPTLGSSQSNGSTSWGPMMHNQQPSPWPAHRLAGGHTLHQHVETWLFITTRSWDQMPSRWELQFSSSLFPAQQHMASPVSCCNNWNVNPRSPNPQEIDTGKGRWWFIHLLSQSPTLFPREQHRNAPCHPPKHLIKVEYNYLWLMPLLTYALQPQSG